MHANNNKLYKTNNTPKTINKFYKKNAKKQKGENNIYIYIYITNKTNKNNKTHKPT